MSSTRWESSKRPLFVKSVWMDGYRHAILTKEDPVAKRTPSSTNRLRSSKQNSARSKLKSSDSSSSDSSSLVIPAVQLLLADVHRLNRTENEKQYPERKKLVKSITFNVISSQHPQIHVKNFNLDDLTPSSKHISLSYNLNSNNNNNKIEVIERLKSERIEQSSSSLTERVLLWLDLAGRFSNEYSSFNNNIEDDNKKTRNIRTRETKRIATAYPSYNPEKTAQFFPVNHNNNNNNNNNNVFVRKCTKNTHFIASNHDSDIDLSFENEDDYSILKEPRKIQSDEHNNVLLNQNQEQVITSHVENVSSNCKSTDYESNNEQLSKNFSHDLSKRQVHIFMPIMKKNTESTSVISCSTNAS